MSAAAGQSSCDRDWSQKVWYGALESGWPSSDSIAGNDITCLEPLLNCQCSGVVVTLETVIFFLGLGLSVKMIKH